MRGALHYAEHFHCAFLFNPDLRKVLFIGLGGGTGPIQFLHSYPGIAIDAVEIDPAVIEVSRKYFGLPEHRRLRVIEADGREFVRSTRRRYDLIVVDAYLTARDRNLIPPHLTTVEFFHQARNRLSPCGMLCYNVIGMPFGFASAMPRAVARTLSNVFPTIHAFDVQTSENTVLIATCREGTIRKSELIARAKRLHTSGKIPLPTIVELAKNYITRPLGTRSAHLLTDADAPVARLLDDEWSA